MNKLTERRKGYLSDGKKFDATPSAMHTPDTLVVEKIVDLEKLKVSPEQFAQVRHIVLLSMKQTAALFNVTPQYIYKMIDNDRFPKQVKLGRMTRFKLTDLEQYLETCVTA